jgi:NAD(P)-dependent dehydrogenase (short-subunit alcohol dehydrogenase family)
VKKIITITTGMADTDLVTQFSIPSAVPYSASKIALNMVTAKYHITYKSEGILFLGISPGLVSTAENKTCEFSPFLSLISSSSMKGIRADAMLSSADTEEELEGFKQMIGMFKEYAPKFTGPIEPKQSVDMVLSVIAKATVEKDGGGFVSHYGNKQWL